MTEIYTRAQQNLIPITTRDFVGILAPLGVDNDHGVIGKKRVPAGMLRHQQLFDDGVISGNEDINGLSGLTNHAGELGAAPGDQFHLYSRVQLRKSRFYRRKRDS